MAKKKPEQENKVGPPFKFTIEVFNSICDDIASSDKGLSTICKGYGIGPVTFYNHIRQVGNEELLNNYTRARDMQADFMADQIIEIADFTAKDTIHVDNEAGGYDMPNTEWINRSKLRVEARKWIAAKLKPKKYGDKVDVTTGGEKINVRQFNIIAPIDGK